MCMRFSKLSSIVCSVLLLFGLALVFAGCDLLQQGNVDQAVVATKEQASQIATQYELQATTSKQQADELAQQGKAEESTAKLEEAKKAEDTAKDIRSGVLVVKVKTDGSVDWGGTATGLSAMLPPPWNLIVPGVLTISNSLGLFAWLRQKAASKSIVKSVDAGMLNSPELMKAFKEMPDKAKAEMHKMLTPAAWEMINKVSVT
jgi:hypothetical protein